MTRVRFRGSELLRIVLACTIALLLALAFLLVSGLLAYLVPPIAGLLFAIGSWAPPLAARLLWHGHSPERTELPVALLGDAIVVFLILAVYLVRTLHSNRDPGQGPDT